MNCNKLRENLLDLATGIPNPEAEAHLRECAACAAEVVGLRQTMAMLDEWKAPEASPYFDVRLHAKLREEKAREQAPGWMAWLRKPAAAVAFTGLIVAGVALFQVRPGPDTRTDVATVQPVAEGTAVGDLQTLEENADLLANFELLEEIADEPQPENR